MLDAASSPLISALPQYERSFQDHLSSGQAYLAAMQVCLAARRQAGWMLAEGAKLQSQATRYWPALPKWQMPL